MRQFNILTLFCVSTLALGACGSDQPNEVGTKDDIIVTNRGLPSAPSAPVALSAPDVAAEPVQVGEPQAFEAGDEEGIIAEVSEVSEVKEAMVEAVPQELPTPAPAVKTGTVEQAAAIQKMKTEPKEIVENVTTPVTGQVVAPVKQVVGENIPVARPTQALESPKATPITATSAAIEELNCDPNKLPANAVAGGCYARAVIARAGSADLNCMELRQILCKDNMGEENVKRIQMALRNKGYNIPVDGVFGASSIKAMDSYQRKNKLPTNALTYESLNHLGVDILNAKK